MEAHAAKQSGDGTGARAGLVNEDHGALALELAEFVLDLVGGNVAAVGDVSLREVGRLADVDDLGTLAIDELGRLSGRDFGSVAAGVDDGNEKTEDGNRDQLLLQKPPHQ